MFPRPCNPTLRGLLRVGGRPHYMSRSLVDGPEQGVVSDAPLWWPPNRVSGRYLAPYLSRRGGPGVMHHEHELADLQPR